MQLESAAADQSFAISRDEYRLRFQRYVIGRQFAGIEEFENIGQPFRIAALKDWLSLLGTGCSGVLGHVTLKR